MHDSRHSESLTHWHSQELIGQDANTNLVLCRPPRTMRTLLSAVLAVVCLVISTLPSARAQSCEYEEFATQTHLTSLTAFVSASISVAMARLAALPHSFKGDQRLTLSALRLKRA